VVEDKAIQCSFVNKRVPSAASVESATASATASALYYHPHLKPVSEDGRTATLVQKKRRPVIKNVTVGNLSDLQLLAKVIGTLTNNRPLDVALEEARQRRKNLGLSPKTGLASLVPDFMSIRSIHNNIPGIPNIHCNPSIHRNPSIPSIPSIPSSRRSYDHASIPRHVMPNHYHHHTVHANQIITM
jgi:hypothetical protein